MLSKICFVIVGCRQDDNCYKFLQIIMSHCRKYLETSSTSKKTQSSLSKQTNRYYTTSTFNIFFQIIHIKLTTKMYTNLKVQIYCTSKFRTINLFYVWVSLNMNSVFHFWPYQKNFFCQWPNP